MPYLSLLPLLAAEASALGLRTAAGMTAADVNLPGAAAFFLIVGTVAGLTAHVDVLGGTAAGILHSIHSALLEAGAAGLIRRAGSRSLHHNVSFAAQIVLVIHAGSGRAI